MQDGRRTDREEDLKGRQDGLEAGKETEAYLSVLAKRERGKKRRRRECWGS